MFIKAGMQTTARAPVRKMKSFEKLDYRFLLAKELEDRQRKNKSYSLRAFSRHLGVTPAFISQVFGGKRELSEVTGMKFVQKMKWPVKRRRLFMSLLQMQKAPDAETKKALEQQVKDFSELDLLELQHDQFELISLWHHFAIVELIRLPQFKADPKWIARRLNIDIESATSGWERLQRIGLIKKEVTGKWVQSQPFYGIKAVPSEAIRNFHRSHLKAALAALENQSFESRDITGTTLALPTDRLPEMKLLIKDFQDRANRLCAEAETVNSVYQLSVQLFRLDQNNNPEKNKKDLP